MIKVERINFQSDNYLHTCRLPDFAKVLDISFDIFNQQIEILYEYRIESPSDKMLNIWITNPRNLQPPFTDDYYYWGKLQRIDIGNVDLSFTNNGKVPVAFRNEIYYVFLMEIKSQAELRDQKIETLTNG